MRDRRHGQSVAESRRCSWAETNPLLRAYHDNEWGTPVLDGRILWEMLMLEGFQAGLAWITILKKRPAFRRAFAGFDPVRVARFDSRDVERLRKDAGIVRSRAKIESTIAGAQAYLTMQTRGEEFSSWVWQTAGGRIHRGGRRRRTESALSRKFSTMLKNRGFRFVGPVVVYAWLQAVGVIDDHDPECYRRRDLDALAGFRIHRLAPPNPTRPVANNAGR